MSYHCCPNVGDKEGKENIIAALGCPDCITRVSLYQLTHSLSKMITLVMTVPFPALKELCISSLEHIGLLLPATFLGKSALHLQLLTLGGIVFQALYNLLSSAYHLSNIFLMDIPINWYIPPQALATCLTASPHLKYATIGF